MSIVVLESGVSSTPVLLTNQCGFNQIADEGAGWVVPATIEGISAGLDKVLSDAVQIDVAAAKIHKYVTREYSWEMVVQRYWSLYFNLLRKDDRKSL
jgi:glycosyltransferase involved in cell wall biosynthesis